jgi:hypothetical protein
MRPRNGSGLDCIDYCKYYGKEGWTHYYQTGYSASGGGCTPGQNKESIDRYRQKGF